jgi:Domain of unknown function (DUF4258)
MVNRFIWTEHAESRAAERGLSRFDIETVIREGHRSREINPGHGDWRIYGSSADGKQFAVVYDHPVLANEESLESSPSGVCVPRRHTAWNVKTGVILGLHE